MLKCYNVSACTENSSKLISYLKLTLRIIDWVYWNMSSDCSGCLVSSHLLTQLLVVGWRSVCTQQHAEAASSLPPPWLVHPQYAEAILPWSQVRILTPSQPIRSQGWEKKEGETRNTVILLVRTHVHLTDHAATPVYLSVKEKEKKNRSTSQSNGEKGLQNRIALTNKKKRRIRKSLIKYLLPHSSWVVKLFFYGFRPIGTFKRERPFPFFLLLFFFSFFLPFPVILWPV